MNILLNLEQVSRQASPEADAIASEEFGPLSSAQRSFLFLYRLNPKIQGTCNLALCVRIFGQLDVSRLSEALNTLTARHPMLRARFSETDGEPSQHIEPSAVVPVEAFDARDFDEDKLLRHVADDYARPFDLTLAPLMRASVYHLADEQSVLLLVFDHIVCDAWSLWRLIQELDVSLRDGGTSLPTDQADKNDSYLTYVREQRQWLNSARGQKQLAYWREALTGDYPDLNLPEAKSALLEHSGLRRSAYSVLGPKLTQAIKDLASKHQSTPNIVLLSGYFLLLHRLTGEDRISIGSAMPARGGRKWYSVVGNFINLVGLRVSFEPGLTVKDLLGKVHSAVKRGMVNQDYPFVELVEQLAPRRDPNRHPFFQTLFTFQNPRGAAKIAELVAGDGMSQTLSWGGYEVAHYWRAPTDGAKAYDLALDMIELDSSIIGIFNYAASALDAGAVERIIGVFRCLLEAMTADDSAIVGSLPLLDAPGRLEALKSSRPVAMQSFEDLCVHELIEAQVRKTPDSIAVVQAEMRLSYAELNARANQLAHYLTKLGVGPEKLVVICMERGINALIGLLAIWKSGGAYLPLDPAYPAERLRLMIEDSRPSVLLTAKSKASEALAAAVAGAAIDGPIIDLAVPIWAKYPIENPDRHSSSPAGKRLAYVIYTSGSTGRPKGVMVEHGGVVNLLRSMLALTQIEPSDRMLALTTLGFDIAGLELWLPLICGAQVVLANPEANMDPGVLAKALANDKITLLQATPAAWSMLIDWGWPGNPGLKALCGGEALSAKLAERISERVLCLWNLYGPTETTIWSSAWRVPKGFSQQNLVPIGQPLTNTSIYLLDAFGELAPIGVKAEIYIGGVGVARGYINRPDLTAERFLADPFGRLDTEPCTEATVPRMYRTGDLGCRLADGTIKFLGRADSQVKVRGHRIELGEVEACLSTSPGVRQTAVIAYPNADGTLSLAAFYSIAEAAGSQPGIAELRTHMHAALPSYMVPTRFVQLESLPLTPNGKLDRKALLAVVPEPDTCAAGAYEAPASEMEVALARIWADILERKLSEIGRQDDFFELGGHSLSITKLTSRIHEILDIKVAVAAIFAVPTLAGLALSLEHAAKGGPLEIDAELRRIRGPADAHLISYHRRVSQRSGHIPAVFAIGEPTMFRSLALRLGDAGQPFFTICPLETELPYLFGQHRIEDIAGFYLELLRRAQSKGPYVLLGFCGAGAVAFEMARQLEAQAALVILVDAWAPGQIERLGSIKTSLMRLSYGWSRRRWLLRQLPGSSFVKCLAILFQMFPYSGWALNRLSQGTIFLSKSTFETLFEHFLKAAEHYHPPPCKQPALVIRSETQPQWRGTLSELGWSSFSIGPIDSAVTPGLHEDIFNLPYVEVMTRIILTCNLLARLRSSSKDP